MKQTYLLKNFLSQQQATLSPEEFDRLCDEVERLTQEFSKILGEIPAGSARAQKVHEFIDEQNDSFSHIKTSCGNGCAHCCHLEVEITEDDAERLADAVIDMNLSIDENRLDQLAQRERLDEAWKMGFTAENRCVMLDENNSCRAYQARPFSCRKHSVVSPVAECATLGASPISRIIPMNEIFATAYINLPELQKGSLSKLLSRALSRRKTVKIHDLDFIEKEILVIKDSVQEELETFPTP